jgi:hypothetical protein
MEWVTQLAQDDLISRPSFHPQGPYFQMRSRSQMPGTVMWTYNLGERALTTNMAPWFGPECCGVTLGTTKKDILTKGDTVYVQPLW